MQNDAIELFDALAATERNGGEVNDRKVKRAAKELGGEAGVVMKKVAARFEGDGEGSERREQASIITVEEYVGGNGEVVGAVGGDLSRDVGRDGAALRLTEEGEDLGADVRAVEAGLGTEEGDETFELGLGKGCIIGEVFPAGEIEAGADQKGRAGYGQQTGPSGVQGCGVGHGGVAAESATLIERVDRRLLLRFGETGVEEGEGVTVASRQRPLGGKLAIQIDQQRMAGVPDMGDRRLEGHQPRCDGGVRSQDASTSESQRFERRQRREAARLEDEIGERFGRAGGDSSGERSGLGDHVGWPGGFRQTQFSGQRKRRSRKVSEVERARGGAGPKGRRKGS